MMPKQIFGIPPGLRADLKASVLRNSMRYTLRQSSEPQLSAPRLMLKQHGALDHNTQQTL
jgi:hypothetical protein